MRIRRARPSDAEEMAEMHRASIREICSAAYTAEQVAAWTEPLEPEKYLAAMEKFEVFVAEEQGVVGLLIVNLPGAELNALYLHPAVTSRGIGRRLVAHAERLAGEASITELKLKATLNAVGFYEACGFARVEESHCANPSGVDLPCIDMVKRLEP